MTTPTPSPTAGDNDTFVVRTIGTVRDTAQPGVKQIRVRDEFALGLDGIEEHLHLVVLYWLHRLEHRRQTLRFRPVLADTMPRGRGEALDIHGVFASRAPLRPNPIALSVVGLVERNGHVLTVRGLDADDGSPVLDIKPYFLI